MLPEERRYHFSSILKLAIESTEFVVDVIPDP
jgi:hypothetical protein